MSDLDPRLNAYRPDLADVSLEGRVAAARFTAGRPAQLRCGVAAWPAIFGVNTLLYSSDYKVKC